MTIFCRENWTTVDCFFKPKEMLGLAVLDNVARETRRDLSLCHEHESLCAPIRFRLNRFSLRVLLIHGQGIGGRNQGLVSTSGKRFVMYQLACEKSEKIGKKHRE